MWAEAVGGQCGLKLSEAMWTEAVEGRCGLKLSEGSVG